MNIDMFWVAYSLIALVTLPISGRLYRMAGQGDNPEEVPAGTAAIVSCLVWPLYWLIMLIVFLKNIKVWAWLNYAITGERP